jgi:hypothetical protein
MNLRTAKCYCNTAWPGSRLKYRGHGHLRAVERAGGDIDHGWRV